MPKILSFLKNLRRDCKRVEGPIQGRPDKLQDVQKNDTMTPEEELAMTEAIENILIIEKIIKFLDFHELKSCRSLNKTWSRISTRRILQLDSCQIEFSFNYISRKFCYMPLVSHNSRPKLSSLDLVRKPDCTLSVPLSNQKEKCLKDFLTILEKSSNYPCSHFILKGGNLAHFEVTKFLKIHGPHIQNLELLDGTLSSKKTFIDIITVLAVNIRQLKIVNFDLNWNLVNNEEDSYFELPALKTFVWDSGNGTELYILDSSPNLTTVLNFNLKNFTALKVEQPCLWVSHIKNLECDRTINPIDLSTFLHAGPSRLQNLCFQIRGHFQPTSHVELLDLFVQLLERNRKSLENLSLGELCTYLPVDVFLPKFTKLVTLKLGGLSSRDGRCFPRKINLKQVFPNLKVLDCSQLRCHEDSRWWSRYFPGYDAFSENFGSVETLVIPGDSTEFWCRRFGEFCPNFNKLVIHAQSSLRQVLLTNVFKIWPQLEGLEVESQMPLANLDSILMGMSRKAIGKLGNAGKREKSILFKRAEIGPSLRDLKQLKKLRVAGWMTTPVLSTESLPISHVTGLFVRQFVPDVKVVFEVDRRHLSLEDVKLIHELMGPLINIHQRRTNA